jgi:hypothetical protein
MIKEVEKLLSGPPLKKLKDSLKKCQDIENFISVGNTFISSLKHDLLHYYL